MRRVLLGSILFIPFWLGATDGGIQVSDNPPYNRAQLFPQVVETGNGNCIVAWEDNRNDRFGIYAQKLNSSGQRQWISDVYVTQAFTQGHITSLAMCNDGVDGGAYIAFANWQDGITGLPRGFYLQHITSSGTLDWAQPLLLQNSSEYPSSWAFTRLPQRCVSICTDGEEGCWLAFLTLGTDGSNRVCYTHVTQTKSVWSEYAECWDYEVSLPKICMVGSKAVGVYGIGKPNGDNEQRSAEIDYIVFTPNGGSYSSSGSTLLDYRQNPPNYEGFLRYDKVLDVDLAPSGTSYVHVVSRIAQIKKSWGGPSQKEFTMFHAHEVWIDYWRLDLTSGSKTHRVIADEHQIDQMFVPIFIPVEETKYRSPQLVPNGSTGDYLVCYTSCAESDKKNEKGRGLQLMTQDNTPPLRFSGSSSLRSVHLPSFLTNSGGGCFVAWSEYPTLDWSTDFSTEQDANIYLAAFNSDANLAGGSWGDVKTVCKFSGPQSSPYLAQVATNRIVVVWCDKREATQYNRWRIYAQSYNASTGIIEW